MKSLVLAVGIVFSASAFAANTDLLFKKAHGKVEEFSIRSGRTSAHIYVDSEKAPYLFFAFPGGNSGVGAWFSSPEKDFRLKIVGEPRLHPRGGVEIELTTGVKSLVLSDQVLGSIRFIRDRELGIPLKSELRTERRAFAPNSVRFLRRGLNGLASYKLDVSCVEPCRVIRPHGPRFESDSELRLIVRGHTTEPTLTPLTAEDVFLPESLVRIGSQERAEFSFLLYKEKLAAGSPRYLSKFGRDTMVTMSVLFDDLKPEAIESWLGAMCAGAHPTFGFLSHEEHEGDFASWDRMQRKEEYRGVTLPLQDYKMIDGDFMFARLLAKYLSRFPERAEAFLATKDARGIEHRQIVRANFALVETSTAAFAKEPVFTNLIRIKKGETVGNWRDSENGLGRGVYPFDVNVALVPSALHALAALRAEKASEFHDAARSDELKASFKVWNAKAPKLFRTTIAREQANAAVEAHLRDLGFEAKDLPAPLAADQAFPAVALRDDGSPVPVMHSDETMLFAFGFPSEQGILAALGRFDTDYPHGLATPVGFTIANAVYAGPELLRLFGPDKYHGRVSWGMQEDLLLHGLERQLSRSELSADTRAALRATHARVTAMEQAKAAQAGTELFSIVYRDGAFRAVPFAGDAKSNSNQLWSHLRILAAKVAAFLR